MRSLFLRQDVSGSSIMPNLNQEILNNGHIKLTLLTKYELPEVTAMVLTIQNLRKRSIVVPVQKISVPKLMAIASNEDILQANGQEGDQTLLFMIVRN